MIKQNKLSLTKKLDGGYIHVKRSLTKSPNKRGGYAEYLKKMKGGSEDKANRQNKRDVNKRQQINNEKKIVSVKLKDTRKKSPKKVTKEIKDIPNIIPKKRVKVAQPKADVPQPEVAEQKAPEQKVPEQKVAEQKVVQPVKAKGSLKKQKRSNGRRLNKSLTKRRKSNHKKGKRISVTKTRKYTTKDISKIQNKLKDIKNKSDKDIKEELEKQGVKLSGKSPEIMKDVYMYSQLCGINIKRE